MPVTTGLVEFIQEQDGTFTLYTCDERAARQIGARFDGEEKCYVARGKRASKGREYKIRYAKPAALKRLRREYAKYVRLQDKLLAMQEQAEKMEAKLIKILLGNGLNLKPGKPRDRQLLAADDTRLQHCQAVYKFIDVEAAKQLRDQYSELDECFVTREVESLDRELLKDVLAQLPDAAARAIEGFDIEETFREIHLPAAECPQCGGKLAKDGVCRRCKFDTTTKASTARTSHNVIKNAPRRRRGRVR